MDPECAICHALHESINNLQRICTFIDFSQPTKKKDFGLYKSVVEAQIKELAKLVKYHDYFHATGEALNDSGSGIQSGWQGGGKPQRFRRFPNS